MFRRKQNQMIQLINVRPLGAESDHHHDSCQENAVQSSSSRGIWRGRGLKAKMTPERRSKSLEGNLDNIDLVTVADQDRRKSQYSSQPHGLDVNTDLVKDDPQSALHVSPVQGRRLRLTTTPPSSLHPSPPSTTSTAAERTLKTHVELHESREPQPKQHNNNIIADESVTAIPASSHDVTSMKTQQKHSRPVVMAKAKSGENQMNFGDLRMLPSTRAQHLPTNTNYAAEPGVSGEQFRDRTDTANSIKFDISYDL